MAFVVVAGGVWTGYRQLSGSGCTGQLRLTVATAPEVAPAVETMARQWMAGGAQVEGQCVAVNVTAASPVDVAAAVAGRLGVSLAGVGKAGGGVRVPDVWVPDSSTWLLRLQSAAAGLVPVNGQSIARSSVVVAAPEPVAKELGWPNRRPSYAAVLQAITRDTELHPGIVDPTRDAAGLSSLLALTTAAGNTDQPAEAVMKGLSLGNSTLPQDLLNKFPRAADTVSIASAKVTIAPLSEQALIAYNASKPPVRLAALYLRPEPPPLDYPYVALPGLDSRHADAAEELRAVLTGNTYRDQLATLGLRGPDGIAGTGFAAPRGAPADVTPTPESSSGTAGASGSGGDSDEINPDADAVQNALRSWDTVTSRS